MGAHDLAVHDMTAQLADGRHLVPHHLWEGILNHVLEGCETGNFLSALFENNLLNAVCGADEVSLAGIRELMLFMHNYAPSHCWGSPQEVLRWREAGGIRGGAHLRSRETA